MLWEEYRRKAVSAEEAVKAVRSGDWVEMGFVANIPRLLDEALAARKEELKEVNLRGGMLLAPLKTIESDPTGMHFRWNSWHMGRMERRYYEVGLAYYIPMKFSEVPRYLRENLRTDVVMIQAAPMDEHGYFNLGVTISHYAAAVEMARTVIVEVNEEMPVVHGGYDHAIHLSQVDYIVEGGRLEIPQIPPAVPTDVDRRIAEFLLPEIRDGACIQLGIGGIPQALGRMIAESDLKDLGVHTEMLTDAFVEMVESGRVTNRRKQIDRGRMAFTFAAGTEKIYHFIHENPMVAAYPVDYTNEPRIASANDNLIAINGSLEMDLFGQVTSETAGVRMISGSGGQLDFVEAAYLSKNGKSFLCLPSTYIDANGHLHSRIKPVLTPGSVVTDPRASVHYIVTEYGKVNMKGLSTWQRAEALIGIAHPDFREELIKEAERLRIWRRNEKR
ncbi:acetyl-CoA hydrolase/transferase family protein [Thermicanus aegyptius]|uniref:acetyl-CoA hydrolase/transferase family protein n=1 Tax=Thermicanus aegyptius TaxID=94009 RepID=UPI000416302E|nr:acetyl-CoA hydrolase/transferase C-terminal domain-containing protein [Thermicanus aegyptius]